LKKNLLQHWPLYASVLVLSLLLWLILAVSLSRNQGHLVYALDDAYIHMAMARNVSHYGVWGVTRYGFTSSSSSLLWTLLLSLTYYFLGVSQIAPLLVNLLLAVLVLLVADAILGWYKVRRALTFVALLAIIFLTPLPALILAGTEQILQTLLAMLVTFVAAQVISGERRGSTSRNTILLFVLAPLVTAVRFEGMFLILAIGSVFLLRRRWLYALAFAICGFLPVLLYGIISVSHGWFWLPSSVLLKGVMPDLTSLSSLFFSLAVSAFANLYKALHTFVLLIAVLLVYALASGKGRGAWESRQLMGAILLLTAVPHVEFIQVGPLFRYDAYLFILGVVFITAQLPTIVPGLPTQVSLDTGLVPGDFAASGADLKVGATSAAGNKDGDTPALRRELAPKYLAAGALALLLLFPLIVKGSRLLWLLPQCTTDIYEQQYQMGLFVDKYYQGSTVALNDVGAVNFLADIHCLDLWGLANRDVTRLKREYNYHTQVIARLSRQAGARIAIVYDFWYGGRVGGLPPEWIRVGQWTVPNNVILGGDTVSFYALDPSEVSRLMGCLRDFSPRLPPDVIQSGSYVEGGE
jgi:hypothetical protein